MDLLLLGGMSPRNKEWVFLVADELAPLFNKIVVHEYAHWASSAPQMDLAHELSAIKKQVRDLDNYFVVAKSAGAVLSLKGIAEKLLRPQACLFAGTPLNFVRQQGHRLDIWLKALTMPALFAQNSHDPTASYQEVERYLREHMRSPHYQTIELPGDTHSYDPQTIKELTSKLATP